MFRAPVLLSQRAVVQAQPGILSQEKEIASKEKRKVSPKGISPRTRVSKRLNISHPQGQHKGTPELKNSPLGPWMVVGFTREHGSLVVIELRRDANLQSF